MFFFRWWKAGKRNTRSGNTAVLFSDRALRGKRSQLPGAAISLISSQLKSGTGLALIATVIVAGSWLFVSFIVGVISPRPMVVVQPFEVSEEAAKELHLTGKNAADIFVDRVNSLASEGAEFTGNGYAGSMYLPKMRNMVKIPVESSFNFTIGGIPADAVVSVFRRARYQEVPINGDVTVSSKGAAIRVRWNHKSEAVSLGNTVDSNKGLEACMDTLAEQFLVHLNPELAGRAFLHERNYPSAIDAFRQWAINEPESSEAFVYLALSISFKGYAETVKDTQNREIAEAIAADQWADPQWEKNKVAWLTSNQSSALCNEKEYIEPESFADWFRIGSYRLRATLYSMVMPDETDKDRAEFEIGLDQLSEPLREDLSVAEKSFGDLAKRFPLDADYQLSLGNAREKDYDLAGAVQHFKLAAAIEPRNAGFQRNIGAEYLDSVSLPEIMPEVNATPQKLECYALQRDNIALHMSLGMVDALNDAVLALHELHDDDSALRLADLIYIIKPESKTVVQQYALTLATVGKYSEAVDAFSAFTQRMRQDAQSRDIALVKLITFVQQNRGAAPALGLAKDSIKRWKDSVPLQLAVSLEWGRDSLTNKKYSEAQVLFDHACQLGNGDACEELGSMYSDGKGMKKDNPKAATYFKKSCDHDSVHGCMLLGWVYATGTGVDRPDYQQALLVDKKACSDDEGAACNNLGLLYKFSQGVVQNYPWAAILFAKACFEGDSRGCSELGDSYLNGTGVSKDLHLAKMHLTEGCHEGDQWGCDELAKIQ